MAPERVRKVRSLLLVPILLMLAAATAGAQTPGKPKVERLVMGLITPYLDYVRPWINGTADHSLFGNVRGNRQLSVERANVSLAWR